MIQKSIEKAIKGNLRGENLKNALDFAAFLRANDMLFVRGRGLLDNVCLTPMIFLNPDADTLAFMKKMAEIRREDIS